MSWRWQIALLLLLISQLTGCGAGVRGIVGGTAGELHSGDQPLSDIVITVHRVDGELTEPIGFADARADGTFELVTMAADAPVRLTPGEYRCTIESSGAPLLIPQEFRKAETTPLRLEWTDSDSLIDLDLPPMKLIR